MRGQNRLWQRNGWRWSALVLVLLLVLSWTGWEHFTAYAHLAVVQAKKLTVRGKPAVQLLIQTDQGAGKEIVVQVGTNKITFQTDSRGRVDTGHMEIPSGATAVSVQMPKPGDELWPSTCQIPLEQIPQNEFQRVTACMDLEPPITRFAKRPDREWSNSEVTVTLEASDAKSGVKQVCYELQGAISQSLRCAAGARVSFSVPSSPNGVTTVRYFAEDNWVDQGTPRPNRESPKEGVVRIDTGSPAIFGELAPSPNANGWNNGPVRVTFRCSDALSGIASCQGDTTLSSEGANQAVTGRAEDRAGNTNSTTVRVNIDRTKPVIRQAGSASCSQPGNEGWCRGEISVPFEAQDNLSGFAPDGRRTLQLSRSTSQEGSSVTVTATVADLAGNEAEPISAGPFKLDRTPPVISLSASSPPPGEPAVVSWEITDALSGVDTSSCLVTISPPGATSSSTLSTSCSGQQSLRAEQFGEGVATVRVRAQDQAGNEGSQSLGIELRRFRQAPTADFSCSPTQGPPPLTVSCSDRSSGEITSWRWDWGDGSTSSERNPSHTYTRSGNYEITLTVRGPGGENSKRFCCIEVLRTGDVRVTLIWSSTADLDLIIVDPNGCVVSWDNPSCPSGGQLDVDANGWCQNLTTAPVENIFWPTGQAPKGEYKVYVNYAIQCPGASSTESFTVRVLVDGKEQVFSGSIGIKDDPKLIYTFRR